MTRADYLLLREEDKHYGLMSMSAGAMSNYLFDAAKSFRNWVLTTRC